MNVSIRAKTTLGGIQSNLRLSIFISNAGVLIVWVIINGKRKGI
jgi:hypothetical protein